MKKLKYSRYKIFYFPEKINSLPKDNPEILPPIHIRIKPTNKCNHNCWYCAYRVENLQLGKDMRLSDEIPKDKMIEIIDDCIDIGVKAITFSGGGEPLRYPHIIDVLKKLADSPIKFAALTNGSNLKDEIAELFAHYGTWIRISMDGWDDETYIKYRKVKGGEFTRIIKNIKNFKKLNGSCNIGISFIIDSNNYKHIYNFVKLVKDSGSNSIKMSPCIVDNDVEKNNKYHKKIFDYVRDEIEKSKLDFEDENFEIYDAYHYLDDRFVKDYNWCPYMQILPVIGADLNIYPCQDKAYNNTAIIGNIKNISFKKFWFNNKENFFMINPKEDCYHHCVSNEKNKMILEYLNIVDVEFV